MSDNREDILSIPAEQEEGQSLRLDESILITPKMAKEFLRKNGFNKDLKLLHLLAFGIGSVAAGFYTNLAMGLGAAGPMGLLAAMIPVSFIYLVYSRVLARFSVNLPYAGGPYAYARQGLGNFGGYLAGVASSIRFIGAAALVLGLFRQYMGQIYPGWPGDYISSGVVLLLVLAHVSGIWIASVIQLLLASSVMSGILLFFLGVPSANPEFIFSGTVSLNGLPGVLSVLPAAMWFYIGLDGIAMSAEETAKPQRDLPVSLTAGFIVVSAISLGIWYKLAGTLDWTGITAAENPLWFVLDRLQHQDRVLMTTFSAVNLTIFAAVLSGMMNGYSRQVYALSRAGYFPRFLSKIGSNRQTPYMAIMLPAVAAVLLSYAVSLQIIIVLTLFYGMLMILLILSSYISNRKFMPALPRPDRIFCHPVMLGMVLCLMTIALGSLIYFNFWALLAAAAVLLASVIYYTVWASKHVNCEAPEEAAALLLRNKFRVVYK